MKTKTNTAVSVQTALPASAPVLSDIEKMLAQFNWDDIKNAKLNLDRANLEPKKEQVKTKLDELVQLVEEIQAVDESYTSPFTVNRLERTQENVLALLKDITMTRTETIRKLSGSSKVVGEFLDGLVKAKTITATKGTNAKGAEMITYSLPS